MVRAPWAWGKGPADPHLNLGWLSHENSLEDFGEVPQVEGVVGLGWSGQQLGGDDSIYPDGGFHEGLRQMGDVGGPSCGSYRQECPSAGSTGPNCAPLAPPAPIRYPWVWMLLMLRSLLRYFFYCKAFLMCLT